ncbi:MAG: DUF5666 domain-containing protein [Anaerolineae bacterium]|nr:DUF5666 domain-containing protein [Anaerolineae bacterium]
MIRSSMTQRKTWLIVFMLAVAALLPALPAQAAVGTPRFDLKFSGVITQAPASPGYPIGVWKIAGRDILVTAGTRVLPTSPAATAGMWADVMAKRQTDGTLAALKITIMPPEIRIKGSIVDKPTDPNGIGDWTIAGLTITVTDETKISDRGGLLDIGNWAEVYALRDGAKLTAVRVRGIEIQPDIEIFGAIEAFSATSWTLSGINLAVKSATLIQGQPNIGLLAHAVASLQEDGSLLALRLKVAINQPGGPRNPVAFMGEVEKLPDHGLIGEWTISGKQVMVSASTAIVQEQGLVVVGAEVLVIGWQIDNRLMAMQVIVLSSPAPGGQFVRFRGPIEALPTSGLIGLWTINGRTVDVTADTRLDGGSRATVGAIAEVGGIRGTDEVVTATWVKMETKFGPGPR